MTKEEIQALIDAKIAGQGSAVDIGGALPAILSGLVELIPESPILVFEKNFFDNLEKADAAREMGITEEQLDGLMNGKYVAGRLPLPDGRLFPISTEGRGSLAIFGAFFQDGAAGQYFLTLSEGLYSFYEL